MTSLRVLAKNPGFTAAAILLLALGLGANLTIFAIINALLIRPLPAIHDPDTLAVLGRTRNGQGFDNSSYPDYRDYRDRNTTFSGLAAFDNTDVSIFSDGNTERLIGQVVSGNYFRVLGTTMALGRDFQPEEDQAPARDAVAIVSHRLWERRWNRSPEVLRKQVSINGNAFTIIGVAAKGYQGVILPTGVDVWVPMMMQSQMQPGWKLIEERGFSWMRMIGRLKPGVTIQQAQANITALAKELEQRYPKTNRDRSHRVEAYQAFGSEGSRRPAMMFLGILAAVTGLALLVVCANVANLMLARATTRRKEIAVRLALGAGRARIIRQMIAEGLMIALAGAGLGLLVSLWGSEVLFSMIPGDNGEPVTLDISPDWRVLAYAVGVALFSTLVFTLLPALQASKPDLLPSLRAGEAAVTPRRSWLRSSLVVAQVSLCLVLLVGAGLLGRSLYLLQSVDPGMRVDQLLLFTLDPDLNGYKKEASLQLYDRLLERIRVLPGVTAASYGKVIPFTGSGMGFGKIYGGVVRKEDGVSNDCNLVGTDFFRAAGITLLAGREFQPADGVGSQRVAIVNETLARKLWPNQNPLGQSLYEEEGPPMQVIGLARDSHYRDVKDRPSNYYWIPLSQHYFAKQTFHIRTVADPAKIFPEIRQIVAQLDPQLPIFQVRTMRAVVDQSLWPQRFAAIIVSFSGFLAMTLATLGLYAVMAYHVAQRTREIGLRMALGASASLILRAVLRSGLTLGAIGLLIGLALSLGAMQVLTMLLYGVTPTDVLTFSVAGALLLGTILAASYIPARRATRVDPISALRAE